MGLGELDGGELLFCYVGSSLLPHSGRETKKQTGIATGWQYKGVVISFICERKWQNRFLSLWKIVTKVSFLSKDGLWQQSITESAKSIMDQKLWGIYIWKMWLPWHVSKLTPSQVSFCSMRPSKSEILASMQTPIKDGTLSLWLPINASLIAHFKDSGFFWSWTLFSSVLLICWSSEK